MAEDIEGWPYEKEEIKSPSPIILKKKVFPMLDDLIGQEEAKRKGKEILVAFKRNDLLEYYGVDQIKGVLLHGPYGTGKTMFVEALSNESEMHFFNLDMTLISDIYVNSGLKNLRSVYEDILKILLIEEKVKKEQQKAVVFIDEIDSMVPSRNRDGAGASESYKITTGLAQMMDGSYSDERILFVAATNNKDVVDKALLRAGRFDNHIEMCVPSKDDLMMLYYHYTHILTKNDGRHNFRGLDYEFLADISEGFVGADVDFVMKESVRQGLFNKLLGDGLVNRDGYVTQKGLVYVIKKHKATSVGGSGLGKIGFTNR